MTRETTISFPWDPRRGGAAIISVLALLLGACGYHAGPLVPEGIRTVAVPVFDNDTFRRGIEVELTQAVAEEFHARTNLRVVHESAAADLLVRGRIASFAERVLADRDRDEITESSVIVRVVVVIEDRIASTQRTLTLEVREPYSELKGQSLASARAEAFENLAEQVVHALEGHEPSAPDRKTS